MQTGKHIQNVSGMSFVLALAALPVAITLSFLSIITRPPAQYAFLNNSQTVTCKSRLPLSPSFANYPLAGQPNVTMYNEQLGTTFTQNFASLAYTMTAVVQTGTDGYGPAYLVNG